MPLRSPVPGAFERVAQGRLDHDASEIAARQFPQLGVEPFPGVDEVERKSGMDLWFHRHPLLSETLSGGLAIALQSIRACGAYVLAGRAGKVRVQNQIIQAMPSARALMSSMPREKFSYRAMRCNIPPWC